MPVFPNLSHAAWHQCLKFFDYDAAHLQHAITCAKAFCEGYCENNYRLSHVEWVNDPGEPGEKMPVFNGDYAIYALLICHIPELAMLYNSERAIAVYKACERRDTFDLVKPAPSLEALRKMIPAELAERFERITGCPVFNFADGGSTLKHGDGTAMYQTQGKCFVRLGAAGSEEMGHV